MLIAKMPIGDVQSSIEISRKQNRKITICEPAVNLRSLLHNISATAFDETGNTKTTSISVRIGSGGIPGFDIPILIIGSILGIISILVVEFKNKSKKKLKKYRN